jgi:hypothetical protein
MTATIVRSVPATSGLPESPETPLQASPWGFTWIGAITTLDYFIRHAQAEIREGHAKGWSSDYLQFQLAELCAVREYLLTEHEDKMGYPFMYHHSEPAVAEQDS